MSSFLAIELDDTHLRLAAAGDRLAQREVYERAAGPVFALVRRLVHGRAAAEDVFQDCMIAVLHRLGDFRGEAPFGAWVRQVALRQCLMHLRSPWQRARRAWQAAFPDDAAGGDAWQGAAVTDPPLAELVDLERALASLSDTARAVVWLHDAEGLTHEEIAATFGRSVSFSKSQLSRAHALLRAQLADPPAAGSAAGIAAQGQLP